MALPTLQVFCNVQVYLHYLWKVIMLKKISVIVIAYFNKLCIRNVACQINPNNEF